LQQNSNISRTNRVVLLINLLLNFITFTGYLLEVIRGERSITYLIIFSVIIFVPFIIALVTYRRNPASSSFKYITLIGYLFFYLFVSFTSIHTITFTYFFCIILMYYLYLDFKLLLVSCITAVIINIARIGYSLFVLGANTRSDITQYMIQIGTLIVFSLSITLSAKLSIVFTKENIDSILKEQKKQAEILDDVLKIAASIEKNAQDVYDIVEKSAAGSDVITNAVSEISTGVSQTAESIQNQTHMAKNIHKLIVDTSDLSDHMESLSNETVKALTEGISHVHELSEKALVANEKNQYAYRKMQELTEKASEIQSITEIITGISEQTNMLSLNASIEAARAGENGRGFAVVADEIRKLAIQSKDSANSIAEILESLGRKANRTQESVVSLKEINDQQTELISNTKKVFDNISVKMDEFSKDVQLVTQRLDEIVASNNKVIDSINEISALSEESSANAQEANSMASINKENADKARVIVNELIETSNNFKKYL